ncbi:MAG: SDR family oxidoreductase [Planctomycetia bacterium]|nr:SDR family oxidoreductase [Planctomycetia bacterium]
MPTALVTGGGIRIGRAIALALGRAGYDVIVHANRSVAEAEGVVRQLATLGRQGRVEQADLAAADGPARLAARIDRLDLLVNNAAAYEHVAFRDITPEQLDRMLAVNVRAPFLLTQALLPRLAASGRGAVVNVTDMAVSRPYTATHAFAHYLASKAALEQLTRAWALELGPAVRVNAVAPGPVAIAADTTAPQRADMLARLPLGREGSPDDVAEAVVYLARAGYVTGQTIRVCGGLSIA